MSYLKNRSDDSNKPISVPSGYVDKFQ